MDRLEHYYKVQNLEVELVPCVVDVNSHRPLQKLWAYYLLNLKKYGCCKDNTLLYCQWSYTLNTDEFVYGSNVAYRVTTTGVV